MEKLYNLLRIVCLERDGARKWGINSFFFVFALLSLSFEKCTQQKLMASLAHCIWLPWFLSIHTYLIPWDTKTQLLLIITFIVVAFFFILSWCVSSEMDTF
jgi:hypothetical protein